MKVCRKIFFFKLLLKGYCLGGSKIWECTFDLLRYLSVNNVQFKDKEVLDLGCGNGLLGIFSLAKEASLCMFQDYVGEGLF